MDKKAIKFHDTELEEYKFYRHNTSISINDIDINEIVESNKLTLGEQKYFIGYKDDKKIRSLCIFFPKMSTYRNLDESNCMHFMIKEENVFDKYNEIWENVSNIIRKNFTVNLYTIKNI